MAQVCEPREVWEKRVSAWQASGLSIQRFAEREGLHYRTMNRWVHRIGVTPKRGRPIATPRVPFTQLLPIELQPLVSAGASAIEIRLRGERAIVVNGEFDEACLARLITVVERAP